MPKMPKMPKIIKPYIKVIQSIINFRKLGILGILDMLINPLHFSFLQTIGILNLTSFLSLYRFFVAI